MSNAINTGDNMVSNNNRSNNALLFLKVAPNTTAGDDGVLSIAFNFNDKEQVEHYRKAATSILNWIDMNEQASGGNATVRAGQVRRYKTPEGKPLLSTTEFSAMRIEDNKERGFSECNFQRQTGRTTAMVLESLKFVKENAMGGVVIEVHNQGMRKRVKELLLHYADEMGVGHRAHARILTKTPSESISGIDIALQLRDNVFDDTKENKPTRVHGEDILDRDKAIVELWDAFRAYMKAMVPFASDEALAHPVLDKYRDFVEKSRT